MSLTDDDRQTFETAQARLRAILPEDYQDTYEDMQPVSMGSAGLKYAADGQVAWNEMWATFCDLAMAGGPPHKGALLEAGTRGAVDAAPERYDEVVEEICRGITMVTDLGAYPAPVPGWVHVDCFSEAMAGWLLRAIVMENVAGADRGPGAGAAGRSGLSPREGDQERRHGDRQDLPLLDRPHVAAAAARDRRAAAAMTAESPLVAPALATDGVPDGHDRAVARAGRRRATRHRLATSPRATSGGSASSVPACRPRSG